MRARTKTLVSMLAPILILVIGALVGFMRHIQSNRFAWQERQSRPRLIHTNRMYFELNDFECRSQATKIVT